MSTAGNSFKQQSLNKPHFWTQKPQHTNSHASRPVERWQDITHSFAMLVAFWMYMLCVWVCASVSAPVCTTAFVSRPCMRASVVFFLPQYELETLSVCEYIASSPVFKFMYPTVELATLFSRVYFVFPCSIFVFCFSLTFIFDDDGNLTQSTGDRVLPELAPGRIRASVKKRGKELTIIFGSTCFSARQRQ